MYQSVSQSRSWKKCLSYPKKFKFWQSPHLMMVPFLETVPPPPCPPPPPQPSLWHRHNCYLPFLSPTSVCLWGLHYSILWSATPSLYWPFHLVLYVTHLFMAVPPPPPSPCLLQVPYGVRTRHLIPHTVFVFVQCTLYINVVKVYLNDLAFAYFHFVKKF